MFMFMRFLKPLFSKLKFRSKLTVNYVIVIFTSVFAVGMYSYYQSVRMLEEKAKQSMDYALRIVVSGTENNVSRYNDAVMSFITNKRMFSIINKGYDAGRDGMIWMDMEEGFIPNVGARISNYEAIERFTLYTDRNVPEIGSYLKNVERIKDKEWYKRISEKFDIYWHISDGSLGIASPMQDMSGTIISGRLGVIYVQLNENKFFENIIVNSDPKYIISITDREGNCIYSTEKNGRIPVVQKDGKNAELDGVKYIERTEKIEENDWNISIYMSKDSLTEGSENILAVTIGVSLLCIAVLVLLGILLSNTITRRIYALHDKMKMVQSGNFDVDIRDDSGDEIGYITNYFGEMTRELKKTVNTLYEVKIEEQKQEMKALQAQINPHFLYNVLSTIKWKAIEADADEASYMVGLLSSFYRTSLNKGQMFISFEQELENVKAYVSMQLVMHSGSFDVSYDIDKELYGLRCINFIIQPVVENAIVHGIDKLEDGMGLLEIKAYITEKGEICVSVSDNGPEPENGGFEEILKNNGKGYGMWNVQERIRLSYGEEYGITFERKDGKTVVKMTLPAENI